MTWMEVALLCPLLLEARPRRVTCVSLLLASAVAVILATRSPNNWPAIEGALVVPLLDARSRTVAPVPVGPSPHWAGHFLVP